MQIKRLRYSSFRNLEQVEFEPGESFNILWGENAQGKTNLLEGIYLLGHLKSFRGALNQTLIHHQQEQACIDSTLLSRGVRHELNLRLNRQQKKELKLDGKRPGKVAEVADKIRQVLFAPEEVMTVKGAPGLRRNMIDRAIFQTHPAYLERVQNYFRLLKQRNTLLRKEQARSEIDVWSSGLIAEGAHIRVERIRFLQDLQPHFVSCYQRLTEGRETPDIRLRHGLDTDIAKQQQELGEELEKVAGQEKQRRTTLAGPHRDDPGFLINQQDLRLHGSQGQQRTFVLAFKVALLGLLKELTGSTAILMLDDITSELDEKRRDALFDILYDEAGQVFITTTDATLLNGREQAESSYFEVRNGQVSASSITKR